MKVEENKDMRPVCPHCEGSISTLQYTKHGRLLQHVVYTCQHCRKILQIVNQTA